MFHYKNITSKGATAVLADATARPTEADAPVSPKPARSRRRRSRRGLWGLIVLIVLAGAGWYAWQHYINPPVQAPATLISLPASKGVAVHIPGNYTTDKTIAYRTLDDYIAAKQLKVKLPVIEEYTAADSSVQIIYLVD